MWGVVARDDGTWFVLDPDAGGETLKRVVLTGGLPGQATVQAAYALVTRVKGDIPSSRSKFVLPVAPTFDEASSHYRAFHVAAAFSAFAYHGLGQVCRREEPFSYESCIIVRNSLYLKINIFIYCI